jgi:hypothetical protein
MPEFWNLMSHRLAGDLMLAPSGRPWRDEEELLDAALGNLANFATLGLTEFPDLSFQCIADDLGIPNRYDGARINVTVRNAEREPSRYDPVTPADLDDETRERVAGATRLDRALYEAGDRHFRDRLRRGLVLDGYVPLHLRTERIEGNEVVIGDQSHGSILYGPYCALPAGRYCATLWVRAGLPASREKPWSVSLDVCSEMSRIHASRAVERVELADRWFEPIEIAFELASATANIEIRLHATGIPALAVRRGIAFRLL